MGTEEWDAPPPHLMVCAPAEEESVLIYRCVGQTHTHTHLAPPTSPPELSSAVPLGAASAWKI